MEKSIGRLKKRVGYIKCIFDDFITGKEDTIKDDYELSNDLFKFLKSKDVEWLDKFHNMVKSFIEMGFIFESNDDIKNIFLKSKDINKHFVNYFFDDLKLDNIQNVKIKNESSDEEVDELEELDIEEINNNNNENFFDNFKWHVGQLEAIQQIKKNGFSSGIVSMITGSGKSLIFLNAIHQHCKTKKPVKGSVYILMCPRIDILRSLFFKINKNGCYQLNNNKINEWKENDIINLDNFKIIDCINIKEKKLKFSNSQYNLLLINNDFFRSLYKDNQAKQYIYEHTNFIIIDECHCISGNKIYEIIKELKYTHNIPIIGFSATPIRDTARSEQNVVQIFTQSNKINTQNTQNKKINLIYSYDLLQGIKDDIVLPYRIECVKINKIKGHKIGYTNKDILNNILKKCMDVKTKKLPYRKFIIWTNRKNIMSECYKYVEKNFKQLKVYCTSSFDKEFQDSGFNVNYEEFYKSKGDCVLICINKCKEGSDIPNIDCGIYFDGVKNRSILTHIQTSGRLIRHDKYKKKTHGDLIDTFVLDKHETPYTLTAQKILSYLTRLLNLSDDEYDDKIEYYNQMASLANNIEYSSKEQRLKIKIDGNNKHDTLIELNKLEILEMDWMNIKKELDKQVDHKFGITEAQKLQIEFENLKKEVRNMKIKSRKIYLINSNKGLFIKNPDKHFGYLWKGWYDLFDINTDNFPTQYEWIKKCRKYNIKTYTEYEKLYTRYNLPELPEELYDIDEIDNILKNTTGKIVKRDYVKSLKN